MLKVNYEVIVVVANQITVIEHARSRYETARLDILASGGRVAYWGCWSISTTVMTESAGLGGAPIIE